jgi:hypothetical protein
MQSLNFSSNVRSRIYEFEVPSFRLLHELRSTGLVPCIYQVVEPLLITLKLLCLFVDYALGFFSNPRRLPIWYLEHPLLNYSKGYFIFGSLLPLIYFHNSGNEK